jgi:hypothetical protein
MTVDLRAFRFAGWPAARVDRGRAMVVCANHRGVAAMVKNIVAGCVLAALIFMVLLSYAQEHHECLNGHLVKTFEHGHAIKAFKPCGSVSPQM